MEKSAGGGICREIRITRAGWPLITVGATVIGQRICGCRQHSSCAE